MVNEKNILLVSFYFAPNKIVGAKRISYLSHYLSESGFNISILTVKQKYFPSKDDALPYSGKIYRVRMFPPYPVKGKSFFHKVFKMFWERFVLIDSFIGWVLPAVIRGMNIIKKKSISTIISSGPPFSTFFVTYILSAITGVKFILDYRDPWFLYAGVPKTSARYKFNIWLEEKILKKANKVVFNTDRALEEYIQQKKNINIKQKSVVIGNALSLHDNKEPIKLEKNKKVILYAGNFYGKRSLEHLIKPLQDIFCEGLISSELISIHVFGKIPDNDKKILSKLNLSHLIHEHNKVNSEDIIRYMKGADLLYLPQGGDVKYSIAFKFYDYLSSQKPILAVTDKNSAMADIMKKLDCGEIVDMNDPASIYMGLKKILLDNKQYRFIGIEEYSWESVSAKFASLIN